MSENKVTLNATLNSEGVDDGTDKAKASITSLGDAAAAAAQKSVQANSSWQKAQDDLTKSVQQTRAATQGQRDDVAALINKIDPLVAAFGRLDSQLAQLKAFKASGAISGDDFSVYAAQIAKARTQLDGTSTSMGKLKLNTSAVRYELGLLMKDLATGQTANFERSFSTLLSRTGLLQMAFSATGVAVLGLLGTFALMVTAAVKGEQQLSQMGNAIRVTGGIAGVTATQMRDMANAIGGDSGGAFTKASAALIQLANSGRFTGQALQDAAQAAVSMSNLTGESIEKTVNEVLKLAGDPVKAVEELNDKYHFLSVTQFEAIENLKKTGDTAGATALAVKDLADTMKTRAKDAADSAGIIEKAWHGISTAISESWNGLKMFFGDIGRTDLQAQYDKQFAIVQKLIAQQGQLTVLDGEYYAVDDKELAAQKAKLLALQDQVVAQQKATYAQAEYAAAQEKGIAADKDVNALLDQHADKATKLANAVKVLNQNYAAMYAAQEQEYKKDPNAGMNPLLVGVTKNTDGSFSGGSYAAGLKDLQNEFKETADASEKAAEKMIANLQQEVAAFGQGKDAGERYKVSVMQMTDAQRAQATQLLNTLDGLKQYKQITDDAAKGSDDLAKMGDKLAQQDDILKSKVYDQDEAWGKFKVTLQEINDAWAKVLALGPPTEADFANYQRAVQNAQNVLADTHSMDYMKKALQEQQAEVKKAAQFWESLSKTIADSLTDAMFKGGNIIKNLGQGLVNALEGVVKQLIATWMQTQIIGVFGGMFGGMGGTLGQGAIMAATQGTAFTGGGTGGANSNWMDSFLGPSAFSSGGSGGGGFSLFSPSSWVSAGKNLWSGFTTGSANAGSTFMGAWSGNGTVGTVPSGGLVNLPNAGGGVYTPSGLGTGLSVAGGLYAGYNEFKSAGGGAAGVAGGLSYGLGTVALTSGIASMAAGGTFAAGVAGGMGAIGLGAIPVVGWVALGLMAVNALTGGGLFGTSWKPTGNTSQDIAIGPDGATVSDFAQEKKKAALFGGTKYKDKSIPVDQQTTDQVNTFYAGLAKALATGAAQLGEAVPDVIAGSFKQTFDKNGKVVTQVSTVLGQTYSESVEDFQTRMMAENLLQLIPASQNAEKIADKWRSSAQSLLDGTEFLTQAYLDIHKGQGLGKLTSLTDIDDVVESLQTGTETLIQTYARLQQETTAFQTIVDEMHLNINKTGKDFITFTDQLVTAAGGLDKLTQEFNDYYTNFYSKQEQVAMGYNNAHTDEIKKMQAIGQDPNESFADFRKNFEAALPDLTPEQVQQWMDASEALIALANASSTVTQQIQSDTQTLTNLLATTQQQANDLFGNSDDQLNAKIAALQAIDPNSTPGYMAMSQIAALQKQIADNDAKAAAAQKASEAANLLSNLGTLGALGGGDLNSLAKMFNIPLDQFAKYLNTDSKGLQDQFDQAVKTAKAAQDTADNTSEMKMILADLLATQQGTPLPYSQGDISNALGIQQVPTSAQNSALLNRFGGPGGPVTGTGRGLPGQPFTPVTGGSSTTPVDPPTGSGQDDQTAAIKQGNAYLKVIADGMNPNAPVGGTSRASRSNWLPVAAR